MRYSIVTLIVVALTSTFAAAASFDQLAATKHNFTNPASPYKTLLGTGTICQPCHTPHHALVDATGNLNANISSVLWNHAMSTATYTLFTDTAIPTVPSGAFTGQVDGSQGMDRVSRLCLGCHDGTVALDAFGMDPAGSGARFTGTTPFAAGAAANLGTDFRDDHPVGVTAQATDATGALLSGSHLKTPTVKTSSSGKLSVSMPVFQNASQSLSLYSITGAPTPGFFVGCRTCHNPHGSGTAELTPYAHLLNCDPAYLCNSCHYK